MKYVIKSMKQLVKKTGLKLFLRRTLGYEFGICSNFELVTLNDIIVKDPLLLLTIIVKSIYPLLAGNNILEYNQKYKKCF